MIKHYIEKVIEKENLSIDESFDAMDRIMNGSINNSQLSGFLIALKSKGETPEEIAGFARAMRDKSIKLDVDHKNVIDVCGTGGDYSGTFNISTAASFIVAGAGVKVAKHGNRSISSKCGSADVLSQLGININLNKKEAEKALNEIGISFLFAPNYHPAMKHAATVRKELGIKTVFNMLGPLTNPAQTKRQLIGVFNNKSSALLAETAKYLHMEKVCFICTADQFDEISLSDETEINEYTASAGVKTYKISHKTFHYPKINVRDIKGDNVEKNAEIITNLLTNKTKDPVFFVAAANSAIALYCAGFSDDLQQCKEAAEESILSGSAYAKFKELKQFGEKAA
jgi:anthranilate phosphoribosyltransferase